MDFEIKIWTDQLTKLLKNSRIHIECQSKLFITIKHELKNEIIKFNVKSLFCETLTKR
jgi:hypothetical protein